MRFDITQKPDPTVCPRQFCHHWQPANWNQRLRTVKERLYASEGDCMCAFGVCTRIDAVNGDYDWYESDNADLEEAGLPWFYFYASPHKLTVRVREPYIIASEAVWGKEHWKAQDAKGDDTHDPSGADTA